MKKISIWEDTAQTTSFKQFHGDAECEVVIIGGGITGLTAALLLSNLGKKVILLEAKRVGLGTTGNSTGNLYVTIDEHLSHLKKKWGEEVMKKIVASRKSALELIDAIVKRYNLDCDFRRVSFNYFAESLSTEIDTFIKEELECLKAAGVKASSAKISDLPFHVTNMLTVEDQAQFHPLKYVQQLAQAASARCEIFEDSAVIDLDDKEGVVRTSTGKVRAKHIVMATHVPKGVYMVQTLLGPYREHGVVGKLSSGACPKGIFWSMEQPKHSVRSFSHNGEEYVMVIGDKYKTGQAHDTKEYVDGLIKFLRSHFDVSEITHTWGGQQYRPADGLPYIGKHGERTYFLTGFATEGLVYGTLGAQIVSSIISGEKNEWQDVYKLSRFNPIKSFKEFFSENVNVIGEYLKDVPWTAAAVKDIRSGEGKVIELHGEKLAVYRDEKGIDHVCSAVCTHMKCIVNWNQVEKTWDCPCHGSRFTYNGHVIEGPAISPLPKKKLDQD